MVILRDEKTAYIKHLAEILDEKSLSFANDKELEELLQVEPGAVTPFGLLFDKEKKVQLIVDEEVVSQLDRGFSSFCHTTTLNIAYADFLRFLEKAEHTVKRICC